MCLHVCMCMQINTKIMHLASKLTSSMLEYVSLFLELIYTSEKYFAKKQE